MDEYAVALAEAVEATLPEWVVRSVERILVVWSGQAASEVMAEAEVAARVAVDDVGPKLRELLDADVDEQRNTPLTILRGAVRYPTEVLRAAGVPPVVRDEYQERRFPDDDYDLTPATFVDIDPALHEPGLAWGAAKAFTHLQRHRP